MPPVTDLDTLEYKLKKRGFIHCDAQVHPCERCGVQAIKRYQVLGKIGGRDITLCLDCGDSRSWRSGAGMEDRSEEPGFDLRAFLG